MVLSNTTYMQITTNPGNQTAGSGGAKKPITALAEPLRGRAIYIDLAAAIHAFQSRFGQEQTEKFRRIFSTADRYTSWDEWVLNSERKRMMPGILEYLMRLEDEQTRETLDVLARKWSIEIAGHRSKATVFAHAIRTGTVDELLSRIRTCTPSRPKIGEIRSEGPAAQTTGTKQERSVRETQKEQILRGLKLAEETFIAKFGADPRERLRRIIEKDTYRPKMGKPVGLENHLTILRHLIDLDPNDLTQMLDIMDVPKWPWKDASDTIRVVVLARAIRTENVVELLEGIAALERNILKAREQRREDVAARAVERADGKERVMSRKKEQVRAFLAEMSEDRRLQAFLALLPTYERVEDADWIPRFEGERARKIFSIAYLPGTGPVLDGLFDRVKELPDIARISRSKLLEMLPRAYFKETCAVARYKILKQYWESGKGEDETRDKLLELGTNLIALDSKSARIEIPKLKVIEQVKRSEVSGRIQMAEQARARVIIKMGMAIKVLCAELERRLPEIGGMPAVPSASE